MQELHLNPLIALLDDFATHLPLDKDYLRIRLGVEWPPANAQSDWLRHECEASITLADGTRITRITLVPAEQDGRKPFAGFAFEGATLTVKQLEQHYGTLQLVAFPSAQGTGPERAWVFQAKLQDVVIRFGFPDGSSKLSFFGLFATDRAEPMHA